MANNRIVIFGAAGFIGFHTTIKLFSSNFYVLGLDSINDYYDINLKKSRLSINGIEIEQIEYGKMLYSTKFDNYKFIQLNLEDKEKLNKLFLEEQFEYVINLGAQAGVSYSIKNPVAYINSNIFGYLNVLECCRHHNIQHLIYASTSSVYGLNQTMPLAETASVNHPLTLYSATKKSNELMAHSYSYLFQLPTTGLRFFTVYGTWGRPDMALFSFANSIIRNKAIDVFNNGNMIRDFTYIDDVIESIERVIFSPAEMNREWSSDDPLPDSSSAPYKIYNVGNGQPSSIISYISALEKALGKRALINFKELQPGDVLITHADSSSLLADIDFKPNTTIEEGVNNFVNWFKVFYKV